MRRLARGAGEHGADAQAGDTAAALGGDLGGAEELLEGQVVQDIDLGEEGMIPLEIRWLHRPGADEGYVGAALSSTIWHVKRARPRPGEEATHPTGTRLTGGPQMLQLSMDGRRLYVANSLHSSWTTSSTRPGRMRSTCGR